MTNAIWCGSDQLKNCISIILVFPLLSTTPGRENKHHERDWPKFKKKKKKKKFMALLIGLKS